MGFEKWQKPLRWPGVLLDEWKRFGVGWGRSGEGKGGGGGSLDLGGEFGFGGGERKGERSHLFRFQLRLTDVPALSIGFPLPVFFCFCSPWTALIKAKLSRGGTYLEKKERKKFPWVRGGGLSVLSTPRGFGKLGARPVGTRRWWFGVAPRERKCFFGGGGYTACFEKLMVP